MLLRMKSEGRIYVPRQPGKSGIRFIWCLFGHLCLNRIESTSSSVIAPRLFPFLYMSIFVWLAAGSPCFRAAAAYINECLLRHLRTLLVRIRASTGLAALASATVRLMQNTTRMGRWQLHQETGPQQAKRPCARGARIRGDDQVGTDG